MVASESLSLYPINIINMDKLIEAFPQNMLDALHIAAKMTYRTPQNDIRNVVICGMGGSGIGGKIVSEWMQTETSVPILILNDYELPYFVDTHSLVIGSSYSGNTEETMHAIQTAHQRGAHIIGICSGGELSHFCLKNGYDHVLVPGGNPPRSQVAFSIVQLCSIFSQLGFCKPHLLEEIRHSHALLSKESDSIHQTAERLASFLHGKVGVFYAGPHYEGVAIRARQQFNENSKLLCWHHVIPEMNHNELVGWAGGDTRFAPVFLNCEDNHPRNKKRFEFSKKVISNKTAIFDLDAKGNTLIQRSFYLIHLVDWASWYLVKQNGVDPFDISVIDSLKDELSNFN